MAKSRKSRGQSRGTEKDLVLSYLQNSTLEQAENYIKRGRSLSEVDAGELKDRWVHAFRRMVAAAQSRQRESNLKRRDRTDIEAELLIRNVDLPYDAVRKEMKALFSAAEAAIKDLRRDPSRVLDVEAGLQADLSAFKQKGKTSTKN
jgi:hypothetical protein